MRREVWLAILLLTALGLVAQAEIAVTTAPDGSGSFTSTSADNHIFNNGATTVYRTTTVAWGNRNTGARIWLPFMRFDLDSVEGRHLENAVFKWALTYQYSSGGTFTDDVWGMIDTGTSTAINGEKWDASTLTWTLARTPVASAGLGWVDVTKTTYSYYGMNEALWVKLGTITYTVPGGTLNPPYQFTSTTTNLNLNAFIAADTNRLVTLCITPAHGSRADHSIHSYDSANVLVPPRPEWMPTLSFPNAYNVGSWNPVPANASNTTNTYLPTLSWKTFGIPKYVVSFGQGDITDPNSDPNLYMAEIGTVNVTGNDFDASIAIPASYLPMTVPARYSWIVKGYTNDPNGNPVTLTSTSKWIFNTIAIPEFTTDPTEQHSFAGDTTVFTAVFNCAMNPSSVKWYKEAGATDIEVVNGGDVTIATTQNGLVYTTTLSIANTEVADEGEYYCVPATAFGTDTSAAARLIVKRLLAHYAFEDNADDSSGNAFNGTLVGTPVFANVDPNLVGLNRAIELDGVDDNVTLPSGFAQFTPGLTFSIWAMPTLGSNNARLIELSMLSGTAYVNNLRLYRSLSGTSVIFEVYNYIGTTNTQMCYLSSGVNALVLNEWQHLVVTVDASKAVTIYKNGMSVGTGAVVSLPLYAVRDTNYIGKSTATADSLYKGQIDDVRIYNYGISADDAGYLYSNVAGNFCRYRPAYDYDNNCLVDIGDLLTVSATWLDCGLWPNCP